MSLLFSFSSHLLFDFLDIISFKHRIGSYLLKWHIFSILVFSMFWSFKKLILLVRISWGGEDVDLVWSSLAPAGMSGTLQGVAHGITHGLGNLLDGIFNEPLWKWIENLIKEKIYTNSYLIIEKKRAREEKCFVFGFILSTPFIDKWIHNYYCRSWNWSARFFVYLYCYWSTSSLSRLCSLQSHGCFDLFNLFFINSNKENKSQSSIDRHW